MFDSYRRLLHPESLFDVIEPEILRQLMDGFYYKQRAGLLLLYSSRESPPTGRRFHRLEPVKGFSQLENERFNPFCARYRKSRPERDQLCENCDDRHAQEIMDNPHVTKCYNCHMGLYDFRYPISIAGKILAVFLAGQRIDKTDPKMLETIDRTAHLKAPEIAAQLSADVTSCAESPQEIGTARESFEKFGAVVQSTVNALYRSQLREAMSAAVVEVNEYLGQQIETCPNDLANRVQSILDAIAGLFAGQPLIFLVRRRSRYCALAASKAAQNARDTTIPVVDCISLPHNAWHTVRPGDRLRDILRKNLRIDGSEPINLFRVSTPSASAAGLGVILCTPWAVTENARDFLAECSRAMAHPVNTSLLFDRMRQQQAQFAVSVTYSGHQLKTPIQSALFSAYRLEQAAKTGALSPALVSTEAIRLRNRLLMAFIDAKQLQSAREPAEEDVEVLDLFRELISVFQPIGLERSIRLHVSSTQSHSFRVHGSRTQLRVALQNIIDNAVKYSFANKDVNIRLQRAGANDLLIEISDFGVGFSDKDRQRLFQLGARVGDYDPLVERHGTGIGLAQAKEFIENHGGTIDIDSVPQVPEGPLGLRYLTVVRISLPSV